MARPGFTSRADVAERRAAVLRLRIEHVPYAEIAAQLGIGQSTARMDYQRALEQRKREQDEQAGLAVAHEEAKLDAAEQAVWEVLRRKHITVQNGKIIGKFTGWAVDPDTGEFAHDGDGKRIPVIEPIEDDAPVLQAADRLLRIAARRASLRGYDAPTRVEVSDAVDAEIARLAGELAGMEPGGEAASPGDAPGGEERTAAP